MRSARPGHSRLAPAVSLAVLLVLLAGSIALADEPGGQSPLEAIVFRVIGDVDALTLFEPAWPGLHDIARCGEELFASHEAPDEIFLALELTVRPNGSIAEATIGEIEPESEQGDFHACVQTRAGDLVLASRDRTADIDATVRLLLTPGGSPAPAIGVARTGQPDVLSRQGPRMDASSGAQGMLGAIGSDSGSAFSTIGSGDLMAIGGLESDGSTYGVGGLGMRTEATPSDAAPSDGERARAPRDPVVGHEVTLSIGGVTVLGGADEDVYRRVFRQHRRELQRCVEAQLRRWNPTSGSVSITFVVNPEGAVVSAAISGGSSGLGSVHSCMTTSIRRWTFPAPTGGGIVRADVTLNVTVEEIREEVDWGPDRMPTR